jgi:hypothetical protein
MTPQCGAPFQGSSIAESPSLPLESPSLPLEAAACTLSPCLEFSSTPYAAYFWGLEITECWCQKTFFSQGRDYTITLLKMKGLLDRLSNLPNLALGLQVTGELSRTRGVCMCVSQWVSFSFSFSPAQSN